jgi:RND family efflux transporter MFP subunit
MVRLVSLCVIFQLAVSSPASAEEFDCVIDPTVVVRIGSPVSGLLESVRVRRGDVVEKGQEIARVSSDVEQATVELLSEQAASRAEIEAQITRSKLARNRLARTRELADQNVTSKDRLEEAIAEFEVVQRELALAEMRNRVAGLELERARKMVDQRTIRSPIDGVILDRALFSGEFLDQDGHVATIAQLDPLHVEAFLPVSQFGKIQIGTPAQVTPAEPIKGTFTATVTVIDRVFDAASGTFGVRSELDNADHQIPAGHRCRITFQGLDN